MVGQRCAAGEEEAAVTNLEKRKRFIINFLYWAIIIGILMLFFRYLLGIIWPFFFAFLFAAALTPVIRLLTTKCRLQRSVSVALCLLVFFAIVGGAVIAVTAAAVNSVQDIIAWLSSLYSDIIEPALTNAAVWIEEMAERIGPEATEAVNQVIPNIVSSVGSAATRISMQIMSVVSSWVTQLPGRMLYTLICAIATVFMTADFPHITAFLMRQIPEGPRLVISKAKDAFVVVVLKYGKSYGLIMCITFLELLVGLLILRQQYAALIALIIAVFDIFPIVGAGLILIPWSVIAMLSGSLGKGLGILALYIVVTVIRQIIEPRIVGHQVGLHPIVTLTAMIVGSSLFGAVGLLGLPIACAIIKSLDDAGVIHVFRREQDDPAPAETEEKFDENAD